MVQSTHTIAGMIDIDLQAYEEPTLVALYSRSVDLQPPEATLFERLRSKLGSMDVLDLGVGAGRTSLHFAPVAKSYLGVDYSAAMIEACSRRMPGVRFLVGDARSMDFAANSSFDLVLFSYNGIDHLTGAERAQFLLEARQILRPGGFLIFSSHNSNFVPSIIAKTSLPHRGLAARHATLAEMGDDLPAAQSGPQPAIRSPGRPGRRRHSRLQVGWPLLYPAGLADRRVARARHGGDRLRAQYRQRIPAAERRGHSTPHQPVGLLRVPKAARLSRGPQWDFPPN